MEHSKLQYGDHAITIHHQGSHLSSWLYQGQEQLFLSSNAIYKPSKAIRGGVPICFPQFGSFGSGNSHGFARNVVWQEIEPGSKNLLCFELNHNKNSLEQWPYKFKAGFELELKENTLTMRLNVENLSEEDIEFTVALHTYFRVSHIQESSIHGLEGCEYWNNGTEFTERQQQEESKLMFDRAIDRVYFNTNKTLTLTDKHSTRHILSSGFKDTVVWNPWIEGAKTFTDMADDEYQVMLCIESANVEEPVTLQPGAVWQGYQVISIN